MRFYLVPFGGGYRLHHIQSNHCLYVSSVDKKVYGWGCWNDSNMVFKVDIVAVTSLQLKEADNSHRQLSGWWTYIILCILYARLGTIYKLISSKVESYKSIIRTDHTLKVTIYDVIILCKLTKLVHQFLNESYTTCYSILYDMFLILTESVQSSS